MRIVFLGTPIYVVPVVQELYKAFRSRSGESPIIAVVTQKPKPAGRKQQLEFSEIDHWAHKHKVPIYFDPRKIVEKRVEADVAVLASYGEIIPSSVIKHFPHGIVNIHPSILPKFRGASPVQGAIMAGEMTTGVSFIQLDEKLDHGPIISQFKEEIKSDDTTENLRNRLFERSAEVLPKLLEAHVAGKTELHEQDHNAATFTTQIRKDHGYIDPKFLISAYKGRTLVGKWEIPFIKNNDGSSFKTHYSPLTIDRFIRAMQPWPVAWSNVEIRDKKQEIRRLKIHKAHLEKNLVTSHLSLVPDTVQLEGKNPVSWRQFTEAYPNHKFES
jgi:methionyl-tRNA formyltransferase